MRRETLKTIGGIIIIGIIVVITFLYGNKQRQDQLRRDQEISQDKSHELAGSTSTNQAPTGATPAVQQPAVPTNGLQGPATTPAPSHTPDTGGGGDLVTILGLSVITGTAVVARQGRARLRATIIANS